MHENQSSVVGRQSFVRTWTEAEDSILLTTRTWVEDKIETLTLGADENAEVVWLKSETNKYESKPTPIYSVVRHCPRDL